MGLRVSFACLTLLLGFLSFGAPVTASAAAQAAPAWAVRGASVTTDADSIVDSAPADGPMKVVVTERTPDGPDVHSIPVRSEAEARRVVSAAQDRSGTLAVGMAQPMSIAERDPRRDDQWALDRLSASSVWRTTKGRGVTVAVVDTGVRGTHPDLVGRVLPGYDVDTHKPEGDVDSEGHGTHVAGIIAATLDNGIGIAGLAPAAKILPVRVAPTGDTSSDKLAEGIIWAADNGADVINLSLGGTGDDPTLEKAVAYATGKNIVVVAAAGNERLVGNSTFYPAAYPGVVGVGAIDIRTHVASFSNSGPYVDVVAPGVHVLSTFVTDSRSGYAYLDGTSMASPYVAATAALIIAETGAGHRVASVVQQMTSTATDIGAPGRDNLSGAGIVSPRRALALIGCAASAGSSVVRICGADRYETAANLSRATFAARVPTVYVASGAVFADGLGGGAAAAATGAPLLLVQRDGIPSATAQELRRLGPGHIVVIGGTAAVSDDVVRSLRSYGGTVDRVAGADRYATAAAVARERFPRGAGTAYVASGSAFPDALSGVPAAARAAGPLLLTAEDSLTAATRTAIVTLGVDTIVVVGGSSAVSKRVLTSLAEIGSVTRVAGPDRYATSAAISSHTFPSGASTVYLASGRAFPDALSAGAVAGGRGAPVLLTSRTSLPSATRSEITRLGATRVVVLGGTAAVSESVRRQVSTAVSR